MTTDRFAAQPPGKVAATARLSTGALASYGVGIVAFKFAQGGLALLVMQIFTIELKISPALVGTVLMIGQIWDALINPLVGNLTDRLRTRWGRRRPFLALGAILCSVAYPLIWCVPADWSERQQEVYLLGSILLLNTAFAVYAVPYLALGYEASADSHDRIRLQAWRSYFELIPILATGWFYWLCQRPAFSTPLEGARLLGLMIGAAILATGLIPALRLQERFYGVASNHEKDSLRDSIVTVVRNRPFRLIMTVAVVFILAAATSESLGFYVLTYFVCGGDTQAAAETNGIVTTLFFPTALLAIPACAHLGARLGKTPTLRGCVVLGLAASLMKWFIVSPAHPWLWVPIALLARISVIGFWIVLNSMKADACDWEEWSSGRRREGAYSAIGSFIQKGANGLVFVLTGYALQFSGYDPVASGSQSPATLLHLRFLFAWLPALLCGVCLFLLARYPLTEYRLLDLRAELERRRGVL